jgi:hypothetical protein
MAPGSDVVERRSCRHARSSVREAQAGDSGGELLDPRGWVRTPLEVPIGAGAAHSSCIHGTCARATGACLADAATARIAARAVDTVVGRALSIPVRARGAGASFRTAGGVGDAELVAGTASGAAWNRPRSAPCATRVFAEPRAGVTTRRWTRRGFWLNARTALTGRLAVGLCCTRASRSAAAAHAVGVAGPARGTGCRLADLAHIRRIGGSAADERSLDPATALAGSAAANLPGATTRAVGAGRPGSQRVGGLAGLASIRRAGCSICVVGSGDETACLARTRIAVLTSAAGSPFICIRPA